MLVGRRQELVVEESEVAGTPLMKLEVHMPVLDSFGFEPDLRSLTHGSVFCIHMFDDWGMVPGDPFDKSVELKPLEPAEGRELARECMVKTRRRKGMVDKVSITKYFDDPLLVELAPSCTAFPRYHDPPCRADTAEAQPETLRNGPQQIHLSSLQNNT